MAGLHDDLWTDEISRVTTTFARGPESSFGENFSASDTATFYGAGRIDSKDNALARLYDPIALALSRKRTVVSQNLLAKKFDQPYFQTPYARTSRARDGTGGLTDYQENRIWDEIAKHRKTDPSFLAHIPNRDALHKMADAQAKRDILEAEELYARANWRGKAGYFLGGLTGSFTDAPNLLANMLSFGAGGTVASQSGSGVMRMAAREALINGVVQLAISPVTAARRNELGFDTGVGDIATEVLGAAALGGGLSLAGSALARTPATVRLMRERLSSLPDRDLRAWWRGQDLPPEVTASAPDLEVLNEVPATVRADILAADDSISDGVKITNLADTVLDDRALDLSTPVQQAAHDTNLSAVVEALENDAPLPVPKKIPLKRPPTLLDHLTGYVESQPGKYFSYDRLVQDGILHPDNFKAGPDWMKLRRIVRKNGTLGIDDLAMALRDTGFVQGVDADGYARLPDKTQMAELLSQDLKNRRAGDGLFSAHDLDEVDKWRRALSDDRGDDLFDDFVNKAYMGSIDADYVRARLASEEPLRDHPYIAALVDFMDRQGGVGAGAGDELDDLTVAVLERLYREDEDIGLAGNKGLLDEADDIPFDTLRGPDGSAGELGNDAGDAGQSGGLADGPESSATAEQFDPADPGAGGGEAGPDAESGWAAAERLSAHYDDPLSGDAWLDVEALEHDLRAYVSASDKDRMALAQNSRLGAAVDQISVDDTPLFRHAQEPELFAVLDDVPADFADLKLMKPADVLAELDAEAAMVQSLKECL